MTHFGALTKEQYLNLETFRKNGVGVRTPVWFVKEGDSLYLHTVSDSGKVKRIRNNEQVNVAACKMDGSLLGEWLPAMARLLSDEDSMRKVDHLLDQKYGLMKKLFGLAGSLQRRHFIVLELKGSEA